jgi:hypothetical protein
MPYGVILQGKHVLQKVSTLERQMFRINFQFFAENGFTF